MKINAKIRKIKRVISNNISSKKLEALTIKTLIIKLQIIKFNITKVIIKNLEWEQQLLNIVKMSKMKIRKTKQKTKKI